MLRPVGPLPAAVYWRRRLLVLLGVLGVLVGGGWLGVAGLTGEPAAERVAADPAAPPAALDQVTPSLAAVAVPSAASPSASAPGTAAPVPSAAPTPAAPPAAVSGGPCTDDMIGVEVRPDPGSAPVGSKPTFHLVVTNTSPVACVRALDKGLQEVVLLDGAGNRVWGSNDCFPETGVEQRTLQPGEVVDVPVLWSGLSSAPGCTAPRTPPGPGSYLLRGRLDTDTSPDAAFTLT